MSQQEKKQCYPKWIDRSEGDFMLLKLELNQDCVPLFGAVLLSFR